MPKSSPLQAILSSLQKWMTCVAASIVSPSCRSWDRRGNRTNKLPTKQTGTPMVVLRLRIQLSVVPKTSGVRHRLTGHQCCRRLTTLNKQAYSSNSRPLCRTVSAAIALCARVSMVGHPPVILTRTVPLCPRQCRRWRAPLRLSPLWRPGQLASLVVPAKLPLLWPHRLPSRWSLMSESSTAVVLPSRSVTSEIPMLEFWRRKAAP